MEEFSTKEDPLRDWLGRINEEIKNGNVSVLQQIISECIETFKMDDRYKNDIRFLKVWFLQMGITGENHSIFVNIQKYRICLYYSILYEVYSMIMESKGRLIDALFVLRLGMERNAQPEDRLKQAHTLFLERVSDRVKRGSSEKLQENDKNYINPWMASTIDALLQHINPQMVQYDGYYASTKPYEDQAGLSLLLECGQKKRLDIGGSTYQILGRAGHDGSAKIFKAFENGNPEDVVALKIQKPAFLWEFYMYRQLDERIPSDKRMNFGVARCLHVYCDYSILVSNAVTSRTLKDAIKASFELNQFVEEVICVYYTIEMLCILEALYDAGIIHGDFKPECLLIRDARDDLTENNEDFCNHRGPWKEQGLCLVNWGRGIDMHRFSDHMQFTGDCETSSGRCIQMQQNKPWTFQVDAYGLCVIVHWMIHNEDMQLVKMECNDGYTYNIKKSLKRGWHNGLWKELFSRLLNLDGDKENYKSHLHYLKQSFQTCMGRKFQMLKYYLAIERSHTVLAK